MRNLREAVPVADYKSDDDEYAPFSGPGSSFTKKLYDIVDTAESTEIVCWAKDGLSFEVRDPKRLELEVLPKYFRHARFQSFVRQLNFYSFKKISKERNSWVYSHDCFQRGRPELLEHLRRKTNTSSGALTQMVRTGSHPHLAHAAAAAVAAAAAATAHPHGTRGASSGGLARSASLSNMQAAAAAAAAATSFSYGPLGFALSQGEGQGQGRRPSQFFPHALPHLSHLSAFGEYAAPAPAPAPGVRKSISASHLQLQAACQGPHEEGSDGGFVEDTERGLSSARKARRRGSFQHGPGGGDERDLDASRHTLQSSSATDSPLHRGAAFAGAFAGAFAAPGDKKYGQHQHAHAGHSTTASSSSGNDSDSSMGSGAPPPHGGLGAGLGGLSDLQLGSLPTHEQLFHAHALFLAQQQHHQQQAQTGHSGRAGGLAGHGPGHPGLGLGMLPSFASCGYSAPLGGAGPGHGPSTSLGKRAMSPFRAIKTEAGDGDGQGAAAAAEGPETDADADPSTHRKRRQSFDITQFLPRAYDRDGAEAAGPYPTPPASALAGDALGALAGRLAAEEAGAGAAGAAAQAVVGFCLRRDPWRFAHDTPTHVPRLAGPPELEALAALDAQVRCILGPGPSTLYRDIAAYLLDAPALRAELEAYSDALAPFAAPHAAALPPRKQPSSSSLAEMCGDEGCGDGDGDAEMESSTDDGAYGDGGDDESSESSSLSGSLAGRRARRLRGRGARSRRGAVLRYTSRVSPRRAGPSKGSILEDMRTFTSFAALKMQGVAQAAAADLERCRRAGAGAGEEAGARVAAGEAGARVAALAECAASWWDYANLYK